MLNQKYIFIFTFAMLFVSCFAFFTFAQTPPPSFEVCATEPNCVPIILSTNIVDHEDGIIPSGTPIAYRRGSRVRLHVEIEEPAGIKIAKAIIRKADITGEDLVKIPLYNDGKSIHAEDPAFPFGSSGAEDDNIYSNFWIIPYSLQTSVPYCLVLEATDNFGHIYNSTSCEVNFELIDTCLSTCPGVDDKRCNGKNIEICVFDNINMCNAWEIDNNCSGQGDCCGNPPQCCPVSGQVCSTVTDTCIFCDKSCNGICVNNDCTKDQDPDCNNPDGCCGDSCCDNGVADVGETCINNTVNSGENPGSCSQDCPDIIPPVITFKMGATDSNANGIDDVGEISGSFNFVVKIIDDWNEIQSDPYLEIKDPVTGATLAGPVYLINTSGDLYSVSIKPDDFGLGTGTYDVYVTAADTSVANNQITENIYTFEVLCEHECAIGFAYCEDDGADGDDANNVTLMGCVNNPTDGCNDTTTSTCGPFPPATLPWNVCRAGLSGIGACCSQDCDPLNYTPACSDPTHIAICDLNNTTGCYNESPNEDCTQSGLFPNRRCAVNSTGLANCCEDDIGCDFENKIQCNLTDNTLETCKTQANGCRQWVINNPSDNCQDNGEVCHDSSSTGSVTPNCCADSGCSSLGTKVDCGGVGSNWIMDCAENMGTGCFYLTNASPAVDCSDPLAGGLAGGECHYNTAIGASGCCVDDCQPADPNACVGEMLSGCKAAPEPDGCYDFSPGTNCAAVIDGHCRERTDVPGVYNCCVDSCPNNGDTQCNGNILETCEPQVDGCLGWSAPSSDPVDSTYPDNCQANGQLCKDFNSIGQINPNCCTQQCPVIGINTDCGGSGGTWIMDCSENMTTGCNNLIQTATDCSVTGQECHINTSTGISGCCADECAVGDSECNTATELKTCKATQEIDGCFDYDTPQDCVATTGDANGVCADPDNDPITKNSNCCVNKCDPATDTTIECGDGIISPITSLTSCQQQATGCYDWQEIATGADCTSTLGWICYDGPTLVDNAYCDILDNDPPVVILQNPIATFETWFQTTQTDFETAGYVNNNTSASNNPGFVELDYQWLTGNVFVVDNIWTTNATYNSTYVDALGTSVKIQPVVSVPGYYAFGEYTAYIDGGAGPYAWENFAWDGIFPEFLGTSMKILVKSSNTAVIPDFSTGVCDTGTVTLDGDIDLSACTNSAHRYLFYKVTLYSD